MDCDTVGTDFIVSELLSELKTENSWVSTVSSL